MAEDGDSGRRITPTTSKLLIGIISVLVSILAVACGLIELGSSKETAAVGSGTSRVDNPAEASEALQELEVAEQGSMVGYSRKKFPHWIDQGGGDNSEDERGLCSGWRRG